MHNWNGSHENWKGGFINIWYGMVWSFSIFQLFFLSMLRLASLKIDYTEFLKNKTNFNVVEARDCSICHKNGHLRGVFLGSSHHFFFGCQVVLDFWNDYQSSHMGHVGKWGGGARGGPLAAGLLDKCVI